MSGLYVYNQNDTFFPKMAALRQAVYSLAFIGLFRINEVLTLKWQDITFEQDISTRKTYMIVHLRSRKTSPGGGMQSVTLY